VFHNNELAIINHLLQIFSCCCNFYRNVWKNLTQTVNIIWLQQLLLANLPHICPRILIQGALIILKECVSR